MRGSLKKRGKQSWCIRLSLGYKPDPETGKMRRQYHVETVQGAKSKAEKRLGELLHQYGRDELTRPSRQTFGEWLDFYLETAIKPARRPRTHEAYKSIVKTHLKPALGTILLQKLDSTDLDRYYASKATGERPLSKTTLEHHHVVISSSLKLAMKKGLIVRNPAHLVAWRPEAANNSKARDVWTEAEARAFLEAARAAGPQPAAFYSLALDSGMRKGELCGLGWESVDLERGIVSVVRQLVRPGNENPLYGPTKNGKNRTIKVSAQTLALLKIHRRHQAELKLKNAAAYRDQGLVFAKEWTDLKKDKDVLGDALQANNLGQREFAGLIKAASVKTITFHGMRHTCATLLLKAGVPAKVVQERLGHQSVAITLDVYSHVLDTMQDDAADKLGSILHG
jgi:integrase